MFVTRAEADARLSSGSNLLRREVMPDAVKPSSIVEPQSVNRLDNCVLDDSATVDARLDELLSPLTRRPRANYRGQLENQVAIAETALILGERASATIHGLSQPQAHAYKAGSIHPNTAAAGIKKPSLDARIKESKERIAIATGARIESALDHITEDKIAGVKSPLKLAQLSKDLATVLGKVTEKDGGGEAPSQLIIYRPELRVEQSYQTVIVSSAAPSPSHD